MRQHGFYSVFRSDTTVTWVHGSYPIRVHPASDHADQHSMMDFLHLHGGEPQPRIAAALRVHENTVRTAVRLHRLKGDAGFYYRLTHVFILPALMALLRVKTVESLRLGVSGLANCSDLTAFQSACGRGLAR